MIEENIKAVKEAEAKASEMIAAAERQTFEIADKAEAEAKAIEKAGREAAAAAEAEVLAKAGAEGSEKAEAVRAETVRETEAIRAMADQKKDAVIDLIIRELF
ncbi:MAG: hypothetical protein Q4B73_00210 [Lachnospiraceae bacterium]|nr:hypothetical protein [Lachnospiraceae bacterium]